MSQGRWKKLEFARQYIKENYKNISDGWLAGELDISKEVVKRIRKELGLKKDTETSLFLQKKIYERKRNPFL